MNIIRQELSFFAVPDFRNLGVALRVFGSALILMLILPLIFHSNDESSYATRVFDIAVWLVPAAFLSMIVLFLLNQFIHKKPLWLQVLLVWLMTVMAFLLCEYLFNKKDPYFFAHFIAISIYVFALMHYQLLIQRAFSPALAEAQLTALTNRIRPHFLFNSLNAAISLVRTRPDDAEAVLENLADLFRAQLKKTNQESILSKEIELAKSYLDIETIRIGSERLHVQWQIEAPHNACVPHLLLQPLLENAVYHGIEPSYEQGTIHVGIIKKGAWIYIRIENPIPKKNEEVAETHRKGNQIALKNLSDRLFLMFDRDATLTSTIVGATYRIDIRLPYYPYSVRALEHH